MGLLDTVLSVLYPPHRAGRPFIAGCAAIAVAGCFLSHWLVIIGALGCLFCWFFFRNPDRVASPIPGALLAPADGRITEIALVPPPAELGMGTDLRWRIATFLSVLNVHVNRMPASGQVTRVAYNAGKFFNAASDKASDENERNAIALTLTDGRIVAVVQIAGLIARRILCEVREGDQVSAGSRYGIIRFGSRTDLYLPVGVMPVVAVGQSAIGGETVMAIMEV
jgi:phosphatidylserine decarboxylase